MRLVLIKHTEITNHEEEENLNLKEITEDLIFPPFLKEGKCVEEGARTSEENPSLPQAPITRRKEWKSLSSAQQVTVKPISRE